MSCTTRTNHDGSLIAAWIAGFVLYQWLFPTGPSWWVEAVDRLHPPDWGIGATVPSFLVAFAIASVVVPGLRLPDQTAGDQKRVVSPRQARDDGASVLVVGRPISRAEDPVAAARTVEATL